MTNYKANKTLTAYVPESPNSESSKVPLATFPHSPRLAELRIVYKSRLKPDARAVIRDPSDVVTYLRTIWNKRTIELVEDFVVLYLNAQHEVLGWVKIASGGINTTQLDGRLVFAIALQTASIAVVIAHNHPTGHVEPSPEDKKLTTRLKDAGKLLGVSLLDHIIISRYSSFSFNEHGLL